MLFLVYQSKIYFIGVLSTTIRLKAKLFEVTLDIYLLMKMKVNFRILPKKGYYFKKVLMVIYK